MIDRAALAALELDALLRELEAACQTPLGVERVAALAPRATVEEAVAEQARLAAARREIERGRSARLEAPADLREILTALAKDGLVLTPGQLLGLVRLVESAAAAADFLSGAGPELRDPGGPQPGLEDLARRIEAAIAPDGSVRDEASAELARLRGRRRGHHERLERAMERFFAAHPELGERLSTVREERLVAAVRSDLAPARLGLVLGRSSSGATFYVEPFEIVPLNNEAAVLRDAERDEVARILRELSDHAAARLDALERAAGTVGEVDFLLARARLAARLGCGEARAARDGRLRLVEARHPALVLAAAARGGGLDAVVPLTLDLGPGEALVVTGPNTGGKTVALKTVGLAAAAFALGLGVPARQAELPLFASLHVDIGDPQDIAQSLSTFSGHVRNVVRTFAGLELPALVLLDELGAGTDPREGSALAIAVVERLRALGAVALVTSHHDALKRWALETTGVVPAAVEFDEDTLLPTFRLVVGRAGRSNALAVARRMGLPEAVVARAAELLAGEPGGLDTALARIEAAARRHDAAEAALAAERAGLAAERERLAEREAALARREAELRALQAGARSRLRAEAEARIREAVDELKREGEELLREMAAGVERRRLEHRLGERLARAAAEVAARAAGHEGEGSEADAGAAGRKEIGPGDRVRVRGFPGGGRLVGFAGRDAVVEVRGKRLVVARETVEPDSAPAAAAAGAVALAVRDPEQAAREINLVGMSVEDALVEVDKLVDRALVARLGEVRVIHGHGSGRLRAGIHAHLARHPAVKALEPMSQGGATRVVLEA